MMNTERMPTRQPRILLAGTDLDMRSLLRSMLTYAGYSVTCYGHAADFADLVSAPGAVRNLTSYELLILDLEILDDEIMPMLETVQTRNKLPPLVLTSAFSNGANRDRAGVLKAEAEFNTAQPAQAPRILELVLRIVPVDSPM